MVANRLPSLGLKMMNIGLSSTSIREFGCTRISLGEPVEDSQRVRPRTRLGIGCARISRGEPVERSL
jgi:hypothetical protein